MFSRLLATFLLLAPAPLARPVAFQDQTRPAPAELAGTWDGLIEPPAVTGGDPCSLLVESAATGVKARLVTSTGAAACEGRFDTARAVLTLSTTLDGNPASGELALRGEQLVGQLASGPWVWGLRLRRVSTELQARDHAARVVELAARECPETWSLVELEPETSFALDELLAATVGKNGLVGVSLACVVDGKLVDVRSRGWEDFHGDVPASDETRYRWASISKPLTSVACARLVARGEFDLEADVRQLVPEFPDKGATIRARDILCHQSGITHYQGARRTWREYEGAHPFEELACGLDLFAESPLRFTPGAEFAYSTHAWTLLGVALERASKKRYHELVRELVLEPAGMKTTEPDFRSHAIAHRSKGYEKDAAGRLLETFEDDIAWKLPGGGWTSTVGDLARFGGALLGSTLLDDAQKTQLWSEQRAADGKATGMGLGFALGTLDKDRLISHSGGQRKASTFLALLPERGLAVAAMCNTEGAPMGELAQAVLRILRARR
jgi:CubicO group peptidase (beta-lactamase class C family)